MPDVFYPRFIAEQEKWDSEAWLRKPRPVDDATSNGVNSALQVLSHPDCHTLDRFAESASLFMRRSREQGYRGGFSCLVFDHDQAYRRVKRQRAFRALVPVVSPGGTVPVAGAEVFVPSGDLVYLEMGRLLFGEAGSVPGYCCVARVIVVVLCKVLALANGAYMDDYGAVYWTVDERLPGDVWSFLRDVLGFHLHEEKWHTGLQLIYLGMQVTFSRAGLDLCLSANRRAKYIAYIEWYLDHDSMSVVEAAELAGRLSWSCNALFGRCGRAYLVPILRRASNPEARLQLNGRLRSALKWWHRWLSSPAGPLTRSVPAAPRQRAVPPAVTYSDASTKFGIGAVLLLPRERVAYFFRTRAEGTANRVAPAKRVPAGGSPSGARPIDFLEVEAAVVADAVFGPMLQHAGYHEEVSFVDNNVSLAWITDGCAFRDDVDPLIEDMWFCLACRQAYKWWERVSSTSNVADLPSRGLPPTLPSDWTLHELKGVRRWQAPVNAGTW